MLALRAASAIAALAVVLWLLRTGNPFGAIIVVVLAVWLRRTIEARRSVAPG